MVALIVVFLLSNYTQYVWFSPLFMQFSLLPYLLFSITEEKCAFLPIFKGKIQTVILVVYNSPLYENYFSQPFREISESRCHENPLSRPFREISKSRCYEIYFSQREKWFSLLKWKLHFMSYFPPFIFLYPFSLGPALNPLCIKWTFIFVFPIQNLKHYFFRIKQPLDKGQHHLWWWWNKNLGNIWEHTVEKSQTNANSVIMHHIKQAIWGLIWKHIAGKSQTNATSVVMHFLKQAIWGNVWKYTTEKRQTNATNALCVRPLN